MILIWRFLLLVLVILLLVFCMSNLDAVTVKLLSWQSPEMPLFLVLLFVFFFGFFLALFWQALRSATRKKPVNSAPRPVVPGKVEKPKKEKRWRRRKEVTPPESSVDGPEHAEERPAAEEPEPVMEQEERDPAPAAETDEAKSQN